MEYFPNSSLEACQAILTLDIHGFSCGHTGCHDSIQMKLKIQMKLILKTENSSVYFWEIPGHFY